MDQPLSRIDGSAGARRHFRYFEYAMAAFVAILLLSNLIGAAKPCRSPGSPSARASCSFPYPMSWATC
ncbi:MAG: hypothetical protein QM756_20245 [Polyangiaceae bacterium]